MKRIFEIRFIQLKQELFKADCWTTLIAFILYILIILKIFKKSSLPPTPTQFLFILFFSVFSIHTARKDTRLLKQILPETYQFYMGLEYFCLTLPILIPMLVLGLYLEIMLFCFVLFLLPFFNFSLNINMFKIPNLLSFGIDRHNFEWLAGMRRMQFVFVILYSLGIVIGFYHFAGFIILGLITFIFSVFYEECESQFVLTFEFDSTKVFLINKLKRHIWQYTKISLPLLLFYFMRYPEKYIFYVPLLLIYYSNFMVFILNKYKSYIPNEKITSNRIIAGLAFMGMFLPYLFPISFVLCFIFYRKSITNLKTYFHA